MIYPDNIAPEVPSLHPLWIAASTKILNVTDDQQASVVLEGHRDVGG